MFNIIHTKKKNIQINFSLIFEIKGHASFLFRYQLNRADTQFSFFLQNNNNNNNKNKKKKTLTYKSYTYIITLW